MAITLQKERIALLGVDGANSTVQSSGFDSDAVFKTTMPSFTRDLNASHYLHRLPSSTEVEDMSCVLADGSRSFIRRRQLNRVELPTVAASDHSEQLLLSKSMAELSRDAEDILINAIMRKEHSLAAKQHISHREGLFGAVSEDSSTAQNSLWVDKYSPQSFSQVRSLQI